MPNDLTVPTIADTLRDRVRSALLDAIPDEQLDRYIQAEFTVFFTDATTDAWGTRINQPRPSPFKEIVRTELTAMLKEKIVAKLKALTNTVVEQWDNTTGEQRLLGDLVQEMAPIALQGIAKGIAEKCIQAVRNQTY